MSLARNNESFIKSIEQYGYDAQQIKIQDYIPDSTNCNELQSERDRLRSECDQLRSECDQLRSERDE